MTAQNPQSSTPLEPVLGDGCVPGSSNDTKDAHAMSEDHVRNMVDLLFDSTEAQSDATSTNMTPPVCVTASGSPVLVAKDTVTADSDSSTTARPLHEEGEDGVEEDGVAWTPLAESNPNPNSDDLSPRAELNMTNGRGNGTGRGGSNIRPPNRRGYQGYRGVGRGGGTGGRGNGGGSSFGQENRGNQAGRRRPPRRGNVFARHMRGNEQRGGRLGDPSQQPQPQDPAPTDQDWTTWPELTVRLKDLPSSVKCWDIYGSFEGWGGKIVFVEIVDDPQGTGLNGRARFEPVPDRPFWEGGHCIVRTESNEEFRLEITVEPARRTRRDKVQSPVHSRLWYPAEMTLNPTTLEFGSMIDEKTLKVMRRVFALTTNDEDERLRCKVDLVKKKIFVNFAIRSPGKPAEPCRILLEFAQFSRVYRQKLPGDRWAIIIPYNCPPFYSWKRDDISSTFGDRLIWSVGNMWYRITDIVSDKIGLIQRPLALCSDIDDPMYIDIGRWTTFRLVLSEKRASDQILQALRDFNIIVEDESDIRVCSSTEESFWSLINSAEWGNKQASDLLSDNTTSAVSRMPFDLRYQLEVCISRGILSEHRLQPEFFEKLCSLPEHRGRLMLEYFADRGKRVHEPMNVFEDEDAKYYYPNIIMPHYCALTRKVLVTPTTIHFGSPSPEVTNRVLRKFAALQDRFLRVQFTGELMEGRINSRVESESDDELFKRVYRVLLSGIRIGDRLFEFLAFGNSQIREGGAYFFCPTDQVSCQNIRDWMGKFDHIRVVAKYAARLGQCFSTTREIRGIRVPSICQIPDIENNGYCFTDGVGKISKFLAEMATTEMGIDTHVLPSAYQFRMGGCKGVLAVWPDAKNMEVHIRKSQDKFEAEHNGLEIIRCAHFSVATLNRQTITILSCLGVKNEAFVKLLDSHLERHHDAEKDTVKAMELLKKQVDENQTTLTLAEILRHGFMEESVKEPFVLTIMHLWKIWSLKLVKEKARIPVDQSAFVLGCVDETGTLRGHCEATEVSRRKDVSLLPQIFLQVTDTDDMQKTKILTGLCIVGRNPSLHPGDIRVVEAVDVPALRHLRDVVVFPSVGDRDVPSMLSGGDLDGDDFFVIWDPSLLPLEWNYPAMNHKAPKPTELNRDVNVNDLRAFFVKYMKNDVLPTIALAHLATADFYVDGAKNKKCLQLAQLHSKAVDYVKTGEPAEMPKGLRPRRWPHFMEKRVPLEMQYHSIRALGVLYDKVRSVKFNPVYTNSFDTRILDKCPKDNAMLRKARQIKTQYDAAVRRIMGQREISTEFEIWSGFALSKPRVGSGYKLQEDLGREYQAVRQKFRDICFEAAGGHGAPHIDPFVAAMYKVTQEEVEIALYERGTPKNVGGKITEPRGMDPKSMPLISFPWIFHWVLCRIVAASVAEKGAQASVESSTEASSAQDPSIVTSSDLSIPDESVKHLNDGRIIHRGEELNLFHTLDEPEECDASFAPAYEPRNFLEGLSQQLGDLAKLPDMGFRGTERGKEAVVELGENDEPQVSAPNKGKEKEVGTLFDGEHETPRQFSKDIKGMEEGEVWDGEKTDEQNEELLVQVNDGKAAPKGDQKKRQGSDRLGDPAILTHLQGSFVLGHEAVNTGSSQLTPFSYPPPLSSPASPSAGPSTPKMSASKVVIAEKQMHGGKELAASETKNGVAIPNGKHEGLLIDFENTEEPTAPARADQALLIDFSVEDEMPATRKSSMDSLLDLDFGQEGQCLRSASLDLLRDLEIVEKTQAAPDLSESLLIDFGTSETTTTTTTTPQQDTSAAAMETHSSDSEEEKPKTGAERLMDLLG